MGRVELQIVSRALALCHGDNWPAPYEQAWAECDAPRERTFGPKSGRARRARGDGRKAAPSMFLASVPKVIPRHLTSRHLAEASPVAPLLWSAGAWGLRLRTTEPELALASLYPCLGFAVDLVVQHKTRRPRGSLFFSRRTLSLPASCRFRPEERSVTVLKTG